MRPGEFLKLPSRREVLKFVLRTGFVILVSLGVILIPALSWLPYTSKTEFLGPWLTWDGDPRTSIVINWWTEEPGDFYVIVWNSTCKFTLNSSGEFHHVEVAGLSPNSTYFYVIGRAGPNPRNVTKVYSFRTAPEPGAPFDVLVIADEQYHYLSLGATEAAMARVRELTGYDFIISLGDQVDEDTRVPWRRFFKNLGDMAANRTIMPIIGNHEWMEYRSNKARLFLKLFKLPGNGTWYWFEYSDVVFVALSLFNKSDYSIPEYEKEAVREVVSKARSEGKKVVVYYHIPTVTIFLHQSKEDAERVLSFIKEIRPDIVLSGHSHAYCRIDVDGIPMITVSSVGGVHDFIAYNTDEMWGYRVVRWAFEYGYGWLSFDGERLVFRFYAIDGQLIDEVAV